MCLARQARSARYRIQLAGIDFIALVLVYRGTFHPHPRTEHGLTYINSDKEELFGVLLEAWSGSELNWACTTIPPPRAKLFQMMNAS